MQTTVRSRCRVFIISSPLFFPRGLKFVTVKRLKINWALLKATEAQALSQGLRISGEGAWHGLLRAPEILRTMASAGSGLWFTGEPRSAHGGARGVGKDSATAQGRRPW